MSVSDDQQFCLRWNNFQANITSQFETLRDDEDFTDVTIACEGQRFQAHKVVLSACSPFFKELFKANPCPHPIIFMRDVEAQDVVSLMEFMYAGEVNVAQAQLSTFLKTAESLKVRGLTDTTPNTGFRDKDEDTVFMDPKPSSSKQQLSSSSYVMKQRFKSQISSTSTVTSSQDISATMEKSCSPPPKRQCKGDRIETELSRLRELTTLNEESISVNPFETQSDDRDSVRDISKSPVHPKVELPDYLSDDDRDEAVNFFHSPETTDLAAGMDILPQTSAAFLKDTPLETSSGDLRTRRRRNSRSWSPNDSRFIENFTKFENGAKYRQDTIDYKDSGPLRNKLIKLGEGIEIFEDQLRSVKWSDYRKLTRGLATILFSSAELATCSVTGQRWSRAGSGERPVKPALNRAKVQAIISYVATRFPMVEISRIKQVLAYKCKENSTAFKMKAVRYYSDQAKETDK